MALCKCESTAIVSILKLTRGAPFNGGCFYDNASDIIQTKTESSVAKSYVMLEIVSGVHEF